MHHSNRPHELQTRGATNMKDHTLSLLPVKHLELL